MIASDKLIPNILNKPLVNELFNNELLTPMMSVESSSIQFINVSSFTKIVPQKTLANSSETLNSFDDNNIATSHPVAATKPGNITSLTTNTNGVLNSQKTLNSASESTGNSPSTILTKPVTAGAVAAAITPELPSLSFSNYALTSYGPQDIKSTTTIENNGTTLKIVGNGWKKIAFPYTVKADTVLEFDFKSGIRGDVQGIGFDNDNTASRNLMFKLYGLENTGLNNFDNYQSSAGTWKHYKISVGKFYTGNMAYMTFVNDQDIVNPTAESLFANVKVYNANLQAADDSFTTERNRPLTITTSTLLANDSDIDGDRLKFIGVKNPLNGTVSLNVSGNPVFTPTANFTGEASFQYTISDGNTHTATATVTVNVQKPFELGINVNNINDWSSALPFIDAFKSSRPWVTQTSTIWSTEESNLLNLDANGWVKSLPAPGGTATYTQVGTLMYRSLNGRYQGGKYIVLYDGEGTIGYNNDAKKDLIASTAGRDVINVTPSNAGIGLKITATDPNHNGNYLRNIHVIPASGEATYTTQIFNPDYLAKIDPFSTFRFMEFMETNNSTQQNWSDRPTLNSATWAGKGAPVELMVDLANRTQSNAWFNMPHMATNDYVKNFAQYVKDHLNPNLKAYVEYSNEAWNSDYTQGTWIEQQAQKAWSTSTDSAFNKRIDWFSKRTTEITRIWDNVFGTQKERVIGVMGAQAANPLTGKRALQYAWTANPLSNQDYGIDAVAVAPYVGGYIGNPENEAAVNSWTTQADGGLNTVFDELMHGGQLNNSPTGGALQKTLDYVQTYSDLAGQNHVQLLAYEGGQHLVGNNGVENNQALTNLFIQANRDPRMADLYTQLLPQWHQLGGGLFMNFNDINTPRKFGTFGALEHVNDAGSPKYDALMTLIGQAANAAI